MKVDKKCNAYIGILEEIKKWMKFLPLVESLRDKAMRERHWDLIREKVQSNFVIDENLKLKDIYDLELGKINDDVEEICDQAKQESKMEENLQKIEAFWVDVRFEFQQHKGSDVQMLRLSEENFETLEEN
jgi:dynein heavy chain